MSEPADIKPIPTPDEVVEELTKDLESQCIDDKSKKPDDDDEEPYIPDDFDKSDTEEEKPKVPDDYIDEVALKDEEMNLTEDELKQRHKEALVLKNKGNDEFKNGEYFKSIELYTEGLRKCPLAECSDRAILYSNRAASKIQIERKETAVDDCSKAIELNPNFVRAYLRRAKLYEELDKLDESLADFNKLLELDPGNHEARAAGVRLPPLINERNEKLKTEMLGKLKDLGNVFLRPFGLSTENFNLQQDPNTGSYSINFQQNQ